MHRARGARCLIPTSKIRNGQSFSLNCRKLPGAFPTIILALCRWMCPIGWE